MTSFIRYFNTGYLNFIEYHLIAVLRLILIRVLLLNLASCLTDIKTVTQVPLDSVTCTFNGCVLSMLANFIYHYNPCVLLLRHRQTVQAQIRTSSLLTECFIKIPLKPLKLEISRPFDMIWKMRVSALFQVLYLPQISILDVDKMPFLIILLLATSH